MQFHGCELLGGQGRAGLGSVGQPVGDWEGQAPLTPKE